MFLEILFGTLADTWYGWTLMPIVLHSFICSYSKVQNCNLATKFYLILPNIYSGITDIKSSYSLSVTVDCSYQLLKGNPFSSLLQKSQKKINLTFQQQLSLHSLVTNTCSSRSHIHFNWLAFEPLNCLSS